MYKLITAALLALTFATACGDDAEPTKRIVINTSSISYPESTPPNTKNACELAGECLLPCNDEATCVDACFAQEDLDAIMVFLDLFNCVLERCPDYDDACINRECRQQDEACATYGDEEANDAASTKSDAPIQLSCREFFSCAAACEDDECADLCAQISSPNAITLAADLITCQAISCSTDECPECATEINACIND